MNHTLLKNILRLIGSSLLGGITSFAFAVYAANLWGVETYGTFTLAQTWINALLTMTDIGLSNVMIRAVAQSKTKTPEILNIIALRIVLSIMAVGAANVFGWLTLGNSISVAQLAMFSLIIPPSTIILASAAAFVGQERMFLGSLSAYAASLCSITGMVIIWMGHAITPILICFVSINIVVSLIGLRVLKNENLLEGSIAPKLWLSYLREGFPFAIGSLITVAGITAGPLLLSKLQGNAQVGYFNSANRLIQIIFLLISACNTAIFPVFSRLRDNTHEIDHLYDLSIKLILSCGLGAITIVSLMADTIFAVMFPAYLPSIRIFQVLMIYAFFSLLATPAINLLYAYHLQGKAMKILAISIVSALPFYAVLVPMLGGVGVALTYVVITLLQFVLSSRLSSSYVRINWLNTFAKGIGYFGLLVAVGLLLAPFNPLIRSAGLILAFPFCVWPLKLVGIADLRSFALSVRSVRKAQT